MSDSQPSATEQAISQIFERTEEVDPRRLVRQFELDNLKAYLKSTEAAVEAAKKDKSKDGKKALKAAVILRDETAREVVEHEAAIEEYDANGEPRATIIIGYIPEAVLTEYDLADRRMLTMEIGSKERNEALHELDRMLVKHGVKGHEGVFFKGVQVPFSANEDGTASDAVIDLYSRAKWLQALRKAIYLFNTLAEEKKSR
jgi:hypothetical protein